MKLFIKVYVNDIVIKAKSFVDYLLNLKLLFKLFVKYNISISLTKIFLDYFNINLLNRYINLFNLIIAKNKLEAIKTLKYSIILKDLKHYLDLADYLRDNVYYYA